MQPYLESLPSYTNGAPPWTPTNRGHGITFLINQTSSTCVYTYIHIHHIQFLIIHLFRIPSQTIPTYYSRTMNMALRLISLSCHIDTNPFVSHVELMPNSSFQFHESPHTYIILTSCKTHKSQCYHLMHTKSLNS